MYTFPVPVAWRALAGRWVRAAAIGDTICALGGSTTGFTKLLLQLFDVLPKFVRRLLELAARGLVAVTGLARSPAIVVLAPPPAAHRRETLTVVASAAAVVRLQQVAGLRHGNNSPSTLACPPRSTMPRWLRRDTSKVRPSQETGGFGRGGAANNEGASARPRAEGRARPDCCPGNARPASPTPFADPVRWLPDPSERQIETGKNKRVKEGR